MTNHERKPLPLGMGIQGALSMIGMLMQPETFSVEDLRRQLRESPGFSRGEDVKES